MDGLPLVLQLVIDGREGKIKMKPAPGRTPQMGYYHSAVFLLELLLWVVEFLLGSAVWPRDITKAFGRITLCLEVVVGVELVVIEELLVMEWSWETVLLPGHKLGKIVISPFGGRYCQLLTSQ
ncbi:hypothetical protein BDV38DRAFT_208226 [Aspergillus pseudotamarii]|uniref:Uncharacterized protein n=1 Tax=Aspergillus pseudotamarii TaxID=132259 RepID=A0A5N6SFN1_ASPPS|nr:uncharacterized protein BDV38DRAFT_208226 [Aspergillus pseudotamarii]KAE8132510.1 hypothetical protein BDV38DRAFT_208226 [Aspergillus pseudotamarii]